MNTTKAITQEIYDRIRKVDPIELPEAIKDSRLALFTKLSTLQRDGKIDEWKQELKKIRRWIA